MNITKGRTISPEYIEVDQGVRLHVRDWGEGRPIFLIHGWPSSNDIFDYQMLDLAEADLLDRVRNYFVGFSQSIFRSTPSHLHRFSNLAFFSGVSNRDSSGYSDQKSTSR